jgi:hypothetical protein
MRTEKFCSNLCNNDKRGGVSDQGGDATGGPGQAGGRLDLDRVAGPQRQPGRQQAHQAADLEAGARDGLPLPPLHARRPDRRRGDDRHRGTPRPQGRASGMSDPFFLELLAGVGEAARERGCDVILSHIAPTNFEDLSAAMTTSRADGRDLPGPELAARRLQPPGRDREPLRGLGRATAGPELLLGRLGQRDGRPPRHAPPGSAWAASASSSSATPRRPRPCSAIAAISTPSSTPAGRRSRPDRPGPFRGRVRRSRRRQPDPPRREVRRRGRGLRPDRLGAIRALLHAGLSVPGDVSVIGFDNVPFSRYAAPPCHHRPGHRQGRAADGVQAAGRQRRTGQPVGTRADRPDHPRESAGAAGG